MGYMVGLLLVGLLLIVGGLWLRNIKPAQRERVLALWQRFFAYLKRNGQAYAGIPIALALFVVSGAVLRWYQPESGVYDPGILQRMVIAIVSLVVGTTVARAGTRINLKWFTNDHSTVNEKQWLFAIFLLAYCWLSAGL